MEYADERDEDLFRVYRHVLSTTKVIKLNEILEKVVNSPAKRFWVSESRASIVLADMFKGKPLPRMHPLKEEMYRELYRRAVKVRNTYPTMSLIDIAWKVCNQPAPKFYIQASSANIYIHYIKKKWFARKRLGQ